MINIVLTLLIAVCAGLASFIATTGKLIDRRFSGIKQIQPIGKQVILFSTLVVLLTGLQSFLNERANEEKEQKALKVQKSRDSLQTIVYQSSLVSMKNKFDSSNLKTILAVTNTLGAYGYKFDSANTRLVRIVRDSSKTKVFLADAPAVSVLGDNGLKTVDGKDYYISIASFSNGSTGFKIWYEVVGEDQFENLHYLGRTTLLGDNDIISKDGISKHGFSLTSTIIYKSLYVHVKGTYQDLNRTHTYTIDQISHFDVENKAYLGTLTSESRQALDEYINMARSLKADFKMRIIVPGS